MSNVLFLSLKSRFIMITLIWKEPMREEHLSFTFDAPFTYQSFILYYCLCQKLRNERKCNVKCKEALHKISDDPCQGHFLTSTNLIIKCSKSTTCTPNNQCWISLFLLALIFVKINTCLTPPYWTNSNKIQNICIIFIF